MSRYDIAAEQADHNFDVRNRRSPTMKPTDEQVDALQQFAHCNGRKWKQALRHCWETCNWDACPSHVNYSYLQEVRNTLGPSWLMRYRLPKFVEVAR